MTMRIAIAQFLIRIGNFVLSTALMVMRPDDLVEFSRRTYARTNNLASWDWTGAVAAGLNQEETELLNKLPQKNGLLLLLGVGSGREAIPLVKLGFLVTGVDYIPELVKKAKYNAARQGLSMDGFSQEISRLDTSRDAYDVVWISSGMYSCVPTKKRRVEMLQRIHKALRRNGYLICQFYCGEKTKRSPWLDKARKAIAWLTLGNLSYEQGDTLWYNTLFMHEFQSLESLTDEFSAAGFMVFHINFPAISTRGSAILKKRAAN